MHSNGRKKLSKVNFSAYTYVYVGFYNYLTIFSTFYVHGYEFEDKTRLFSFKNGIWNLEHQLWGFNDFTLVNVNGLILQFSGHEQLEVKFWFDNSWNPIETDTFINSTGFEFVGAIPYIQSYCPDRAEDVC